MSIPSRTSTMLSPSSSSVLSDDSKRHMLSSVPPDSKILATAAARIYHMPFNARPESWSYSGLSGTLVFGRNRSTVGADHKSFDQTMWFRLIDPIKGLVWLHQIPDVFDYTLDKPFFHVFSGKSRKFGFRFEEDADAAKFLKQVRSNVNIKALSARRKSDHAPKRLSPSMVSGPAPGSFVHVAHVGFDANGRLQSSEDLNSEWTLILREMQGYGLPKSLVEDERDFVEGFLAGVKALESSASDSSAEPSSPATSNRPRRKSVQRSSNV